MGNPQTSIWQEITQGLGKAIIWIIYVTLGTIAKLAFDSRNTPLTKRQLIVKAGLSLIVGSLTSIACNTFGWVKLGVFLVPLATIVGEELIGYIVSNFKQWMDKIVGYWLKNKK